MQKELLFFIISLHFTDEKNGDSERSDHLPKITERKVAEPGYEPTFLRPQAHVPYHDAGPTGPFAKYTSCIHIVTGGENGQAWQNS